MGAVVNLADPSVEPTDAQLQELSASAFAGVGAAHAASLVRLRVAIAAARAEALRALDERAAPPRAGR